MEYTHITRFTQKKYIILSLNWNEEGSLHSRDCIYIENTIEQ